MIEVVHAASEAAFDINRSYEIEDIIRISVAIIVLVAGMLSVAFILWGGVMLILSGGKEEKIKPAISSIRFSVIGIIIIIIAIFVLPRLGDLLGLNVSEYLTPRAIFTTIKALSVDVFGGSPNYYYDAGIPY